MGKHRRQSTKTLPRTAVASAMTIGAASAMATPVQAATVHVPNSDITFEIEGLENVPNIGMIPGINQWVPEIQQQDLGNYAGFSELRLPNMNPVGQRIVDVAATRIGAPYVWGATGPNAFDCSGLTTWAYAQVGKHIPRTSYAQAAGGIPVSYQDLQPGDIVAFYANASHVGIYTGHGTVINAIQTGTPLGETSLDHMPFHSAVRY